MNAISYFIALFLTASSAYADTGPLTVVYTANAEGKLDGCDCRNDPYGGFGERVTLIENLREERDPFLLLDAGNMISLFGDYEKKSATIMTLMNMMGYDAAGAGNYDLFYGVHSVRAMQRTAEFPLLSASAQAVDGSPALEPWTLCRSGDVSAAVIAVADSATGYVHAAGRKYSYRIIPPEESLNIHLPAMAKAADYVIVLSQLPLDENRRLLADFPPIDLIVQGHGNRELAEPVITPDGVIVCPGGRGRFVGMATIARDGADVNVLSSELIPLLDVPIDPDAERLIQDYYGESGR